LNETELGINMRRSEITRTTNETKILVKINLDGIGKTKIRTGVGFFDHMLEQLSRHSLIDMDIKAEGDLHIDDHHTVEDVGITLGMAIKSALGSKEGICRYGACLLPMDEALIQTSIDFSGRPYLAWKVPFASAKIGTFDVELVQEFFNAVSINAGITMHVTMLAGINNHHIAEAVFKSVAKSFKNAIDIDSRQIGSIPSTKGTL
jgi:imidazoleglycerol-phosphate dehydratase